MSKTPWPEVPLGELCSIGIGKTPPRAEKMFWGPGSPWLSIADMSQGKDIAYTRETITSEAIDACNCRLVHPGTVLLSFKLTVGKVGIARVPLYTNEAIAHLPIRDPSRLRGDYLMRALEASDLQRGTDRAAMGATLNKSKLHEIPVVLPPVDDQRRIAAILDATDELRAKHRAFIALLDSLTKSIFLRMFGRVAPVPVSLATQRRGLPDGWAWEPLVKVAELATGHTPDRDVPEYWDGDIPWVSLTEIRRLNGTIAKSTDLRVSQAGVDNSSAVILPVGTVCFSRTASIGFVTVMGRPMATSQDFVNWVCGERLTPTYLMHALLGSRDQLRAIATGSTHKTIYMRVAEQFHVLVPPIGLQAEFSEQMQRVAEQRARVVHAARESDSLFACLQHRAFRGEL